MKRLFAMFPLCLCAMAAHAAPPALTIYNDSFAVVREVIPLELKSGVTQVDYTDVTARVEPQSVILLSLDKSQSLRVLEQNYRADPVSEELLLSFFEGQTIQFLIERQGLEPEIVQGRIVRSGYVPQAIPFARYGGGEPPVAPASAPIIEINGQMQFGLPGKPLFPSLGDGTILKPTLSWMLQSSQEGKLDAELSYITGGMKWNADYNIVLPESGDTLQLAGWVTINNTSGRDFPEAAIQLMAGDVQKVREEAMPYGMARSKMMAMDFAAEEKVTEEAFDEYHLYTLPRNTMLKNSQTKQVEFLRAEDVASTSTYVYDGANIPPRLMRNQEPQLERDYGFQSNNKIAAIREFRNSEENNLGVPLPKGRMRLYRRDSNDRLQFIGENQIDHTARDEKIRLQAGNSFDLFGERKQTNFMLHSQGNTATETFEITLRNHKDVAVTIEVIEHPFRHATWQVVESTLPPEKMDVRTLRFKAPVPARGETKMVYSVKYTW